MSCPSLTPPGPTRWWVFPELWNLRAAVRIAAIARLPSNSTTSIPGLAWESLTRSIAKTVIRASYSIFYSHAGGVGGRTNGRQGLSQLGFNNSGSLSSTVTGQPAYNWNNGYPGNPYTRHSLIPVSASATSPPRPPRRLRFLPPARPPPRPSLTATPISAARRLTTKTGASTSSIRLPRTGC